MTLPASGTITAAMINVELGRVSTAPFSMNGAEERALAGKSSGTISFSDFHGKSAAPSVTVSIVPSSSITSSAIETEGYSSHSVSVSGGTASSYSWSALDGGHISGPTTSISASLRGDTGQLFRTYQCEVVVDGVTYTPTCTRRHTFTG